MEQLARRPKSPILVQAGVLCATPFVMYPNSMELNLVRVMSATEACRLSISFFGIFQAPKHLQAKPFEESVQCER